MKKTLLALVGLSAFVVQDLQAVLREKNRIKIDRANNLYDSLVSDIRAVKSFKNAQSFFKIHKHFYRSIKNSYDEIATRYNGIAPWNWGKKMKHAYQKMDFLAALFEYRDVILDIDYIRGERSVIKYMKSKEKSVKYPLIYIASKVKDVISRLKYSHYACDFSDIVVEGLSYIIAEICSSSEYTNELRLQEIENLQKQQLEETKKMTHAAERSACALEESNKLKKEEFEKKLL